MVFFKEMRNYIVFFILFGLWSIWINSKFKIPIRVCSFLSIALVFCGFSSAYFFDKFYASNTLSNVVANLLFIFVIITHSIIIIESISKKKAQTKLIQSLSLADHLFNTKSNVMISYQKERCEIFIRCFVLVSIVIFINIFVALYAYYLDLDYKLLYPPMYSYFVLCSRSAQIIFFISLLRNRLILIVEELKDIQKILNTQSDDVNPRIVNPRKSDSRHTRIQLASSSSLARRSIHDRLLSLKQIYTELYRSCEQIRKAFGWSLLVIITQAFVEFTSNSYWGFLCLNDFKVILIYLMDSEVILVGALAYYCSSCFEYVSHSKWNSNLPRKLCYWYWFMSIISFILEPPGWDQFTPHSNWQENSASKWFDSWILATSEPWTVFGIS